MHTHFIIHPTEWDRFVRTRISYDGQPISGAEAEKTRDEFLQSFAQLPVWVQAYVLRSGIIIDVHDTKLDSAGVYAPFDKSVRTSPGSHTNVVLLRHEAFHGLHDLTSIMRKGVDLSFEEPSLLDAVARREAAPGLKAAKDTVMFDDADRMTTVSFPVRRYLRKYSEDYSNEWLRALEYIAIMGDQFAQMDVEVRGKNPSWTDEKVFAEIDHRLGVDIAHGGYGSAHDPSTPYGWFRQNVVAPAYEEAVRMQADANVVHEKEFVHMHHVRLDWQAAVNVGGQINIRAATSGLSAMQVERLIQDMRKHGFDPEMRESSTLGQVVSITGNDAETSRFAQAIIAGGRNVTVATEALRTRLEDGFIHIHHARLNWEAAINLGGRINIRTPIAGLTNAQIEGLVEDLRGRGFDPDVRVSDTLGQVVGITADDAEAGRFAKTVFAGGRDITVTTEAVQTRLAEAINHAGDRQNPPVRGTGSPAAYREENALS